MTTLPSDTLMGGINAPPTTPASPPPGWDPDRRTTPGTIASRTGWKHGDDNRASDHDTVPDRAGSYTRGTAQARAENERMGYGRKQAEVPGDTQLIALLSELVIIARDCRAALQGIETQQKPTPKDRRKHFEWVIGGKVKAVGNDLEDKSFPDRRASSQAQQEAVEYPSHDH